MNLPTWDDLPEKRHPLPRGQTFTWVDLSGLPTETMNALADTPPPAEADTRAANLWFEALMERQRRGHAATH